MTFPFYHTTVPHRTKSTHIICGGLAHCFKNTSTLVANNSVSVAVNSWLVKVVDGRWLSEPPPSHLTSAHLSIPHDAVDICFKRYRRPLKLAAELDMTTHSLFMSIAKMSFPGMALFCCMRDQNVSAPHHCTTQLRDIWATAQKSKIATQRFLLVLAKSKDTIPFCFVVTRYARPKLKNVVAQDMTDGTFSPEVIRGKNLLMVESNQAILTSQQ